MKKSPTRVITYNGKTQTLNDWSRELGIPYPTIAARIRDGLRDPKYILRKADPANQNYPTQLLTYQGKSQSVREWAEEVGISIPVIYLRLRKGLPIDKVLSKKSLKPIKRYSYKGQEKTIDEWAKELGISRNTLRQRLNTRGNLKEAVEFVSREQKSNTWGVMIAYNGKTQNMAGWAKDLGISRERVRQRLRRYPVDQALSGMTHKTVMLVTYKGRTLPVNEWARKLKIPVTLIYSRLRKYPPEVAFKKVLPKRIIPRRKNPLKKLGRKPTILTHNGESLTIAQWADKLGLTYACLQARLRKMSVEESLILKHKKIRWKVEKEKKEEERLIFNGKALTLRQWARRLGILPQSLKSRLKKMPLERALKLQRNVKIRNRNPKVDESPTEGK